MAQENLMSILKIQDDLLEEYESYRKLSMERIALSEKQVEEYAEILKIHEENMKASEEKNKMLLSYLRQSAEFLLDKSKSEETKNEFAWELLDLIETEEGV